MEGTLAEIRMFAGNFNPRGWQFCNGQLLSIAQWTAVFALVGTTYGGNGQTTFGLPDFRGRMARGTGQGPGLPVIDLGEIAGNQNVTLLTTNLPAHNHPLTGTINQTANSDAGGLNENAGNARLGAGNFFTTSADAVENMAPAVSTLAVGGSGGNQAFSNSSPYLGIQYIFCVEGIFPSRD